MHLHRMLVELWSNKTTVEDQTMFFMPVYLEEGRGVTVKKVLF